MRMRCCQTRTGLGMFLEFLGRLPKFCNLTCQSVLLEALQALPSRGCQQQISSFKHCRSGELFMIALGKRRPTFSAKHGTFYARALPRVYKIHSHPLMVGNSSLVFCWASLLIWSCLRKSRARHFRHPALSGWRLQLKDGVFWGSSQSLVKCT